MTTPHAAQLLRELSDLHDPELRVVLTELSDTDLGTLLPAALRIPFDHPARFLRAGITSACNSRQPSFTPESLTDLLAALASADIGDSAAVIAASALLRSPEPPPISAGRLAGALLTVKAPAYAVTALAVLSGGLRAGLVGKLAKWGLDGIARDEMEALAAAGPSGPALIGEVDGHYSYYSPPPLPDAWDRLAAVPGYPAFAKRALESARDRLAAVHAGTVAYRADAAFESDEVAALGRAVRVALIRDEPWLMPVLRPLLLTVAVAPTAAKTLPSQALLYEVARAAEALPTPELLAALREARGVARHKGVHRQLDRKLQRIARALGDRPEVALRLPDLGFTHDGVLHGPAGSVLTLGDGLKIAGVEIAWPAAGGGLSSSVPAALRRDRPEEVKEARALATKVRGHLATLARALEAGFATGRVMPYARWRDELASNPLGRSVVQRLIWEIPDQAGGWRAVLPIDDSSFAGIAGESVAEPEADAEIRLWHPLTATAGEVSAWRDLLIGRDLRQPIKQAFREVYRLTPAEEETSTHSDRFAAHIVHYKQLYALLKARGWTTTMLGPWDAGDTADATRVLAGGSWRIGLRHYYIDETTAGTDRVWFERRGGAGWRTVPLIDVPPLVLSEALRDVDLFVSVTSIAADPAWFDGHLDYWQREHHAELTATAQVRRSALARILPRTKIANRCELTDRHLVVRGDLHTYRIHLGSGNILMEPGNAYLCIVPSRRAPTDRVFIPFDEDRLTVILSKAFLLADDTAITDPSIVAQLRAHHST
ncbi:hypothetical protein FB565_000099 [Actinoplanes lutulentus]|uniref:Uncharacterized protein DUF4132 n=1 Tax=Actinoplanes lutulentus TaxID=1287878 RepID=A0A327YYI5_9ACTN|nr:DUF4132 domain-containing protein [Actinoplanes lutulentus]MBB2940395.1 hypothetical protein [Actinoplanes lutulentus]RAK25872.1 uncharacterized protein DUF4132 [Actinoplanes lutulentus]